MRFHFGISFRWKTIKKFLFPFIIGLLTYFGFSSGIFENLHLPFLTLTKVHAYSNYDTQFNVDIPDYNDILSSVSCGENGTMLDSVKYIIDEYNDQYFQLLVGAPSEDGTQIAFYITRYPTINYYSMTYYGYLSGSTKRVYNKAYYSSSSISSPYYLLTSSNCSTFKNSTGYTNFKYIYNNNLTSSNYPSAGNGLVTSNDSVPNNTWDMRQDLPAMSNSSSYDTNLWFYYSSHDLSLREGVSSTYYYYKKVCLVDNDTCYNTGEILPSYIDLYGFAPPTPEVSFNGFKDSLETIYTNLSPSDINNYSLSVGFKVPQSLLGYYQTPQAYVDNTYFSYYCGGRVDHTNYYTYENFNCSLSNSYSLTDNSVTYTFNNIVTSQNLSSYDKIFVTIKSNYIDSEVSTTLFNLGYRYTLGSFYNTSFKGTIYEDFTSLPLNFKMLFSSNNSIMNSNLYIKNINLLNYGLHYIGFTTTTQKQNLVIGSSILGGLNYENGEVTYSQDNDFIEANVTNDANQSIMLYQQDSAIPLIKLELFFNSGIVISFNNTNNSNDFYYIDNTGTISNNDFLKPVAQVNNKYDISYYVSEVNNFIDSLSTSSLAISVYTQDFYNSMPMSLQSIIFVFFILTCIYFVYLLIRK